MKHAASLSHEDYLSSPTWAVIDIGDIDRVYATPAVADDIRIDLDGVIDQTSDITTTNSRVNTSILLSEKRARKLLNELDEALMQPPIRADGGVKYKLFEKGAYVEDRESAKPTTAVVIDVHPQATAAGWVIEELDETVADLNPGYDDAAPIIKIAFLPELASKVGLGDLAAEDDLTGVAERAGVTTYDYPADRLRRAEEGGYDD